MSRQIPSRSRGRGPVCLSPHSLFSFRDRFKSVPDRRDGVNDIAVLMAVHQRGGTSTLPGELRLGWIGLHESHFDLNLNEL